jgi:8-oxo-dGTP diphosphatase
MIPESKLGALLFILNDKNELLLYRRINTWYEPNKLALVGGNVDAGESPVEAAKREALEETGITVNSTEHLITNLENNYEVHYFLTRDWTGTPTNIEPDRCGGLSWHKLNELPEDTIEEIKDIVKTHVTFR